MDSQQKKSHAQEELNFTPYKQFVFPIVECLEMADAVFFENEALRYNFLPAIGTSANFKRDEVSNVFCMLMANDNYKSAYYHRSNSWIRKKNEIIIPIINTCDYIETLTFHCNGLVIKDMDKSPVKMILRVKKDAKWIDVKEFFGEREKDTIDIKFNIKLPLCIITQDGAFFTKTKLSFVIILPQSDKDIYDNLLSVSTKEYVISRDIFNNYTDEMSRYYADKQYFENK